MTTPVSPSWARKDTPPATSVGMWVSRHANDLPECFWAFPSEALFKQLDVSPEGLSAVEASERLTKVGRNAIAASPRRHALAKIAYRLVEPLILILIVAAAISGATGDWTSFAIILVILTLSIALGPVRA